VAEKPDMESKHQLRPGLADLHGQLGVHFRDSYPIDVSHLSFNFLFLLLL
jgi:hypothetical protein